MVLDRDCMPMDKPDLSFASETWERDEQTQAEKVDATSGKLNK